MLISGELLNVNAPFLTIDSDDLALSSLVLTTQHHNLVILSDWEGTDLSINVSRPL